MANNELQILEAKFENLQKNHSNIKSLHQEEKQINDNVSAGATIAIAGGMLFSFFGLMQTSTIGRLILLILTFLVIGGGIYIICKSGNKHSALEKEKKAQLNYESCDTIMENLARMYSLRIRKSDNEDIAERLQYELENFVYKQEELSFNLEVAEMEKHIDASVKDAKYLKLINTYIAKYKSIVNNV